MVLPMNKKPKILLTRPLWWLDEREEESRQWLMEHFALEVTAFENTADIISFAIEDIEQPIKSSSLKISDFESGEHEAELRQFVALASLVEALDSLHAACRLLLSGYASKMMAALRTMVEALRTADICKDDVAKAREWFQHKEIKKPAKGSVHPIIKHMMRDYDFLSKAGGHPLFYSTVVSSLGKTSHEVFQREYASEPDVLKNAVGSLIEYLNKSAGWFLKYVNEVYSVDWSNNPELKRKRDVILDIEAPEVSSPSQKEGGESMELFKLHPETQADAEFLSRLAALFQEPPRMPTTMSNAQKNALAQFLEKATVEMREMVVTGYALGEALRAPKGKRRPLSKAEKERGLIASAFVIGFEMGHDYALRWGKVF
jgi:hypothetical protein